MAAATVGSSKNCLGNPKIPTSVVTLPNCEGQIGARVPQDPFFWTNRFVMLLAGLQVDRWLLREENLMYFGLLVEEHCVTQTLIMPALLALREAFSARSCHQGAKS